VTQQQDYLEVVVELTRGADPAVVRRWLEQRGFATLRLAVGVLATGNADAFRHAFGAEPSGRPPVPDELRGEEVKVYVVPSGGVPDPAELREWLSGQLAYFKVPRYWTFVDHLPKTPSERVAKGELTAGVEDLRTGAWDATEDGWR
jgi:hypothetical protein